MASFSIRTASHPPKKRVHPSDISKYTYDYCFTIDTAVFLQYVSSIEGQQTGCFLRGKHRFGLHTSYNYFILDQK